MKKEYQVPEVEIISFSQEDVIITSQLGDRLPGDFPQDYWL